MSKTTKDGTFVVSRREFYRQAAEWPEMAREPRPWRRGSGRAMRPNCVEMYDGTSFCGRSDIAIHVGQRDWHDDDGTSLADATCLRCLSAMQALGDQAAAVRAEALGSGATDEQQSAWFVEEKRRVDAIPADRTLTLASFDGMLKQAYDRGVR